MTAKSGISKVTHQSTTLHPTTTIQPPKSFKVKFDFSQDYDEVVKDNEAFCKTIMDYISSVIPYSRPKLGDCTATKGNEVMFTLIMMNRYSNVCACMFAATLEERAVPIEFSKVW